MLYRFIFLIALCLQWAIIYSQNISINEICTDNESLIQDFEDEFPDWIELYNSSEVSINLEGYSLSDDLNDTRKWVFPSIDVPPGGFVLVFASGKNILNTSELHTNFKLSQEGEILILCNESAEIISKIDAVEIPSDQSYGCIPDGEGHYVILYISSPNASNNSSGYVESSHNSGFYNNEFDLELNSLNPLHTIYYTTDGSVPTSNSSLFVGSITIKNLDDQPYSISAIPTTPLEGPSPLPAFIWIEPQDVYKANAIRYASFYNGERTSEVYSKTFFVDENIESKYTLPILSIVMDEYDLFDYDSGIYVPGKRFDEEGFNWWPTGNYLNRGIEWEKQMHLSYFENDGRLGFETNSGIRMRGFSSTSYPQKSFTVYFRKEYGKNNITYPIFSALNSRKYKRFIIRNAGNDFKRSHFKDALLQSIIELSGMEFQAAQPSVLFINGEYWGVYNLREKYDKHYFKYNYGIEEEEINILNSYGETEEGSNEDYLQLLSYVEENDMSEQSSYEYIYSKVDMENYIDFQIFEIYFANYDWPCNNAKIWKSNYHGSKWRFLIYDLDISFGYNGNCSYDKNSIEHAVTNGDSWPFCSASNILFRRLVENPTFVDAFIKRFEYHMNTSFKPENIIKSIDHFESIYEPEMEEHIRRWNYPNSIEAWEQEIEKLREFALLRPSIVAEDLIEFFDLDEFNLVDETIVEYSLSLYPNPSNGVITIQNHSVRDINNAHVMVFDAYGKRVFSKEKETVPLNSNIAYDLNTLPNGMYMFVIMGDEIIEKRQFVIMK